MESLQQRLITSFNQLERKDHNAVCDIIDTQDHGKNRVVVIGDDPYLLTLIFTALIRYHGIKIHILNSLEGESELQRLLFVINPDYVICTDYNTKRKLFGYKRVCIDGETISTMSCDYSYESVYDCNFTVTTYSPFPTKINTISGEVFQAMINAFIQDLHKFNLNPELTVGLIPIVSKNPDYLLYYIATKLVSVMGTLPGEDEFDFVLRNKKEYAKHNQSHVLYIPKKEFVEIWNEEINSLFEYKFVFNSYMKRKWLVNLLIRRRLKKLFKGFKSILIIGVLDNSFMINILRNLSFVKFYTIFPMQYALHYGPISHSLDSIILSVNTFRQDVLVKVPENSLILVGKTINALSFKLSDPSDLTTVYSLTDRDNRFIEGEPIKDKGEIREQYFHLGNVENAFYRKDSYIFPETLEKVINSYPFIKYCALLTFDNKLTLVLVPQSDILDSNRINYRMFNSIIQKQIDTLNKDLPESYKIQHFLITPSLIEQDRNGNIARFALNACNKKWSG
jgi:hypothetical protein